MAAAETVPHQDRATTRFPALGTIIMHGENIAVSQRNAALRGSVFGQATRPEGGCQRLQVSIAQPPRRTKWTQLRQPLGFDDSLTLCRHVGQHIVESRPQQLIKSRAPANKQSRYDPFPVDDHGLRD
jgi:hypothetical protein